MADAQTIKATVRAWRLGRLVVGYTVLHLRLPWWRRVRLHLLWLALLACGPVGAPSSHPTATETIARQAVAAALRAALVEACDAYRPPIDAHPAHAIAWGLVCWPASPPPATVATDAAL